MNKVHDQFGLESATLHSHDQHSLLPDVIERMENYVSSQGLVPLSRHPRWTTVLSEALQHTPYCLEVVEQGRTRGVLPLLHVNTTLFGRFLVSLPYLNYGGVLADNDLIATSLVNEAIQLADKLQVRKLELRQEAALEHPQLVDQDCNKVSMRLELPGTPGALWDKLPAKVRNQVRKGQKNGLTVHWGGEDLMREFYQVFSINMRDLGTPVYTRKLFSSMLRHFPDRAELCIVRLEDKPVAGAILLHGWGMTEVPSASSLRKYNSTCANMLLYWNLLARTVERGQEVFDFGRSTLEASTYRFKKQWGAVPSPMVWQNYLRIGSVDEVRPDNPRYRRMIHVWQRLPVWLTKLIGPPIVRGIP